MSFFGRQKSKLLNTLIELSSKEVQELLWMPNNTLGLVGSFREACCAIYDDMNIYAIIADGALGDPQKQKQLFEELEELFQTIDIDRSDFAIMNDPSMIPVRRKAAEILLTMPRNFPDMIFEEPETTKIV